MLLLLSFLVELSLLLGEEFLFPEKLLVKPLRIPPVIPDLYILPTEERVGSLFLVLLLLLRELLVLFTVERVLLERILEVLSLYWQSLSVMS